MRPLSMSNGPRARSEPAPGVLDRLLVAHTFLTRLRIGDARAIDGDRIARAVVAFPLVGVTVAAAGAGARVVADPLGPVVACIAAVAATAMVTGALHEDGLADTADAFGPHERDRRLAAMRDSRLGVFGVLALVLTVGARVALLARLPLLECVLALVAAHVLGRWSTLPLAAVCRPARPDSSAWLARISSRTAAIGSVPALVVAGAALAAIDVRALGAIPAACVVTAVTAVAWRRAFGGVTGDTYGATNQFVELAAYASVVLVVV